MSIKSNVEYVAKELSGDEKLLESTLKLESFYNKNKKIIAVVVVLAFAFLIVEPITTAYKQMQLESANEAFLTLQNSPKDEAALKILESKNHPLYQLFIYSQAIKSNNGKLLAELSKSNNSLIADISSYNAQVLDSKKSDSIYYKEMSIIEDAYILIKANKMKEARAKLDGIEANSPLNSLAQLLKHYTIKGK